VFSDEAGFHLSDRINQYNIRIWGSENPHAMFEHTQVTPKVNVVCAVSKQMFGPFFFAKRTVTGCACLNMLEESLMPILQEECPNDMPFEQHRAPPHGLS
jgi:hypothetical protein